MSAMLRRVEVQLPGVDQSRGCVLLSDRFPWLTYNSLSMGLHLTRMDVHSCGSLGAISDRQRGALVALTMGMSDTEDLDRLRLLALFLAPHVL